MEIPAFGYRRAQNIRVLQTFAEQKRNRGAVSSVHVGPSQVVVNDEPAEPLTARAPASAVETPVWVVVLEKDPGPVNEATQLMQPVECYPAKLTAAALEFAACQAIAGMLQAANIQFASEYKVLLELYDQHPCEIRRHNYEPLPLRPNYSDLFLAGNAPISRRGFQQPYFVLLTRQQPRHQFQGTPSSSTHR